MESWIFEFGGEKLANSNWKVLIGPLLSWKTKKRRLNCLLKTPKLP